MPFGYQFDPGVLMLAESELARKKREQEQMLRDVTPQKPRFITTPYQEPTPIGDTTGGRLFAATMSIPVPEQMDPLAEKARAASASNGPLTQQPAPWFPEKPRESISSDLDAMMRRASEMGRPLANKPSTNTYQDARVAQALGATPAPPPPPTPQGPSPIEAMADQGPTMRGNSPRMGSTYEMPRAMGGGTWQAPTNAAREVTTGVPGGDRWREDAHTYQSVLDALGARRQAALDHGETIKAEEMRANPWLALRPETTSGQRLIDALKYSETRKQMGFPDQQSVMTVLGLLGERAGAEQRGRQMDAEEAGIKRAGMEADLMKKMREGRGAMDEGERARLALSQAQEEREGRGQQIGQANADRTAQLAADKFAFDKQQAAAAAEAEKSKAAAAEAQSQEAEKQEADAALLLLEGQSTGENFLGSFGTQAISRIEKNMQALAKAYSRTGDEGYREGLRQYQRILGEIAGANRADADRRAALAAEGMGLRTTEQEQRINALVARKLSDLTNIVIENQVGIDRNQPGGIERAKQFWREMLLREEAAPAAPQPAAPQQPNQGQEGQFLLDEALIGASGMYGY